MRVGIFDSGIGGLTVLKTLVKKFPKNEYVYYGDTKNVPYGDKTKSELIDLSSHIINFLLDQKVDVIVIACGTISSNVSAILRLKYDLKIIDIISPTISYINKSKYKKIGVIATSRTIDSKIFSKNINKDVKEVACPMFVPLIENNELDEIDKYIPIYLNKLKDRDLIVLGCTHYPIIKNKISNYLGKKIKMIDMSDCILEKFSNNNKNSVCLYFSKIDKNLLKNINKILNTINYSISEV